MIYLHNDKIMGKIIPEISGHPEVYSLTHVASDLQIVSNEAGFKGQGGGLRGRKDREPGSLQFY